MIIAYITIAALILAGIVAETDTLIVAVPVGTHIVIDDEHLLPLVPHGDAQPGLAVWGQDAVEQVIAD